MKARNFRRTAALIGFALVTASCGSQVDPAVFELGNASATEGAASTSSGTDVGALTGPSAAADGATSATSTTLVGGQAGGQVSAGPSQASSTPVPGSDAGGGTTATTTPGQTKANYASDVGVTANSIKVGNITTIGGPMPGQFEPYLLGLETWVNEVNEKGGVNGRKIQLIPCDDAMDAERNRSCARDLIENQKVFSIVGTNTPAMPSAQYINDQGVPAVGVAAIGNYTSQLPYWFSSVGMRVCPRNGVTDPNEPGYCASNTTKGTDNAYRYFRDTVGVKKAAVFWHNIDISKQAGQDMEHALKEAGIEVVYTAETQVAEPDYTGHVLKMKDAGVEGIWESMEINNNIRLLQAMDRQGFLPKAKVSTASSFSQEIGKQVTGPSRNSLFALASVRPYTDTANPAIANFVKLFDRYFPDKSKHIWNVEGYQGARLFGDAVSALGADLTRQGLVDWLNALENYDPHGLGLPLDFRYFDDSVWNAPKPPKTNPYCFFIAQYKDTDWFNTPGDDIKCPGGNWISARGG